MRMRMDRMPYTAPAAPADIDKPRFGNADEARKLRRLIRHLDGLGFKVHSLAVEGEGYIRTRSERAAVCEVFEWDAVPTLRFSRKGLNTLFGVLIVPGNGEDILADWTFDSHNINNPTPGSFTAAMESFCEAEETRLV